MKKPEGIEGFHLPDKPFVAFGCSHFVYTSDNSGPNVILIHELPGLTGVHISLGRELVSKRFRVHMPLLYGRPNGHSSTVRNAAISARLCLSREFKALARNADRPFTDWLSALINEIAGDNPKNKVGVIGMCLTGGFSIATMANPNVGAGISCQPALPFMGPKDPGMSEETLVKAAERTEALGGCPLLCLRYQNDSISPSVKAEQYEDAFSDRTMRRIDLDGDKHSTLTYDRSEVAFAAAVAHLSANL